MRYSLIIICMSFIFFTCNKDQTENSNPAYFLKAVTNVPVFSSDNAYSNIEKQISFGPRNPNSEGHQNALNFFQTELKKYADIVYLQSFVYPGYDGEQLNLSNVVAQFNPNEKDRIFICAHWDTRPRADQDKDPAKKDLPILGANDAGSGTGIILELARILKENPVKYGIDLILFDGEDYGKEGEVDNYLLGSKYFASQKPADYNPAFGILLDLVGDKEAVFLKEGYSVMYASEVADIIWKITSERNANTFSDREGAPILDDHLPLNQVGIKTIDIIDMELIGADTPNERRNYWHTHKDDMENIGKKTLQQVGDVLIQLIYSLEFSKPGV